jgi:hypothetical protein
MHSGVYALVALNFDRNLLAGLQVFALRGLETPGICPDYVGFLACGNELLELAKVIGMDFPTRPFVLGAADLHGHAVHGTVVRAPYRAENYGGIFGREPFSALCDRGND